MSLATIDRHLRKGDDEVASEVSMEQRNNAKVSITAGATRKHEVCAVSHWQENYVHVSPPSPN